MTEEQKEKIYKKYTSNEMYRLKRLVQSILKKFGGIYDMHMDDFYSVANYTLWQVTEGFDESRNDNFEAYFI